MAEPKIKKLSIEDKLGAVEDKKELSVLKDVAENLPSSTKVRIYKLDEENNKRRFLTSIPTEDFDSTNAHEFIKSKFAEEHGGGDYLIELLDGDARAVGKYTLSIFGKKTQEVESTRHIDIMNKALDMKEEAADKIVEAKDKLHEVEKAKIESTMELMNRQWDAMAKIYESRITDLSKQKESSSDVFMQQMIQRDIENTRRDMEREKDKLISEIKSKQESRSGNDKVLELLTTMIINKREESPMDTISKTMEMMANMNSGGDSLEDIMANPVKLKMYKEMLGIDIKKDFFEELMSNPMKAEMFKKVLGIEEKKKDFMTEMMENPERFKMIQRMMGLPTAEEMAAKNSVPPITPEPKKDFLEQMLDMTQKLAVAKPMLTNMLGVESRPIANLMELVGNVINGAMPHIVEGVKTVSNNLVTTKLLDKGFMMGANGTLISIDQIKRGQSKEIHHREIEPRMQPIHTTQTPIVTPAPIIEQPKGESNMGLEEKFEKMLASVVVEAGDSIEPQALVDKMSNLMINEFKSNPMIVIQLMKYGDKLDGMMANIISRLIGVDEQTGLALAGEISRVTREKAGQ